MAGGMFLTVAVGGYRQARRGKIWRHLHILMFNLIYIQLHMEIFIDVYIHIYMFLFCQLRGPRSSDTSVTVSTPTWFLTPFSSEKHRGCSLEKMLILRLG